MTIGQLKNILQNALNECESFEDNTKLRLESNTYFVTNGRSECKNFLGVTGFDGGYLNLNDIERAIDDDNRCDKCGGIIEWNEDGTAGICKRCGEEY